MNEEERISVDEWVDRDYGILTNRDREYLLGLIDEDRTDNAEYQQRYRIRERIRDAVLDFMIISHRVEDIDIEGIFEPSIEWAKQKELNDRMDQEYNDPPIPLEIECWTALFEFFLYSHISAKPESTTQLGEWALKESIRRAWRRYGFRKHNQYWVPEVELSIDLASARELQDHIRIVEQELPADRTQAYEYLWDLILMNEIPYHIAVYVFRTNFE